jgi:hypothetical protein
LLQAEREKIKSNANRKINGFITAWFIGELDNKTKEKVSLFKVLLTGCWIKIPQRQVKEKNSNNGKKVMDCSYKQ